MRAPQTGPPTPALWRRALEARDRHPELTKTVRLKNGTVQTFSWATGLKHGHETVHAIFCDERKKDGTVKHWVWLTDHRPDKHNVHILANKGARLRWKKGFHKNMTKAFRTLRNFAARLRQAVLTGGPVSTEDDSNPAAIQIRFNTS